MKTQKINPKEVRGMALEKKEEWKTIADVEALPEGTRAELIDGEIFYNMAAPTVVHQEIVGFLTRKIGNYIESNNGKCKVYPAPFDVQLSANDKYNLVQPDVTVVCDRDKLSNSKRCIGAPDWVIEVVSPSTENNDYIRKLMKYSMAGVREYWIIDPKNDRIVVYNLEMGLQAGAFDPPKTLKEKVKVNIYPELEIDFSQLEL